LISHFLSLSLQPTTHRRMKDEDDDGDEDGPREAKGQWEMAGECGRGRYRWKNGEFEWEGN
jgi:hypothetical protein